ncbi:MAG: ComF family protein [Planctomycetes bacterium]|nr:ComF family protein [Planctomycetota bacterium]
MPAPWNFRALFPAVNRHWRAFRSSVLDLLFPPFCRICQAALEEERAICPRCESAVEWIESACRRCGLAVVNPGDEPGCGECRGRELWFDRAFAAGVYEDPLRQLIHLHKYRGDPGALAYVGAVLSRCWREKVAPALAEAGVGLSLGKFAVVPIPSHPVKLLLRGRDPLGELAGEFARLTGLPLRPLLERSRWSPSQTGLSRERRLKNQRRSFRARRRIPVPEAVLLLDDVVTTCSTVADAARALKEAGAGRIYVLAAARSPLTGR